MPIETRDACDWALEQESSYDILNKLDKLMFVVNVRRYFNDHNIEYGNFGYADLEPFLN